MVRGEVFEYFTVCREIYEDGRRIGSNFLYIVMEGFGKVFSSD